MKKINLVMGVLIGVSVMFSGCGKAKAEPTAPATQISNKQIASEFDGAPNWVMNPMAVEGTTLAAVGTAPIGPAGLPFAKIEALAAARDEMARTINVKVNNMVKSFTQQTGVGDSATVDKVVSSVSKQVASQFLEGTVHRDTWVSRNGNIYTLVVLDSSMNEKVKETVKEQTKTSYKNDEALWQQFQAKKAQDELDAAVEKEFKVQ